MLILTNAHQVYDHYAFISRRVFYGYGSVLKHHGPHLKGRLNNLTKT